MTTQEMERIMALTNTVNNILAGKVASCAFTVDGTLSAPPCNVTVEFGDAFDEKPTAPLCVTAWVSADNTTGTVDTGGSTLAPRSMWPDAPALIEEVSGSPVNMVVTGGNSGTTPGQMTMTITGTGPLYLWVAVGDRVFVSQAIN